MICIVCESIWLIGETPQMASVALPEESRQKNIGARIEARKLCAQNFEAKNATLRQKDTTKLDEARKHHFEAKKH